MAYAQLRSNSGEPRRSAAPCVVQLRNCDKEWLKPTELGHDVDVVCLRLGAGPDGVGSEQDVLNWLGQLKKALPRPRGKSHSTSVTGAVKLPCVIVFLKPLGDVAPKHLARELMQRKKLVEGGVVVFDCAESAGGCVDVDSVRELLAHLPLRADAGAAREPRLRAGGALGADFYAKPTEPGPLAKPYYRVPAGEDREEMQKQLKALADWYRTADWRDMD